MGLFTRKRPPLYLWDDAWEPIFIETKIDSHATEWSWTHPDDYHSQLIAFSWAFTTSGIKHTIQEWFNMTDGDRLIHSFGYRTYGQTGTSWTTLAVIGDHSLSAYADTKSFRELPDHFYMLPGQIITFHSSGLGPADEITAVNLYLRRWMMR